MATSFHLSVRPSCLLVETGVRCFLTLHDFIAHLVALSVSFLPISTPSISLCYQAFFFHNCHQFQCFPLLYTIHKFRTCLLYNSCISKHRNAFTVENSITHICSGCWCLVLNDRLIPITTSFRAVVAVVEHGFTQLSINEFLQEI